MEVGGKEKMPKNIIGPIAKCNSSAECSKELGKQGHRRWKAKFIIAMFPMFRCRLVVRFSKVKLE